MITIKIRKWSRAYKISVSGHSGYAAVGSDIVCAGVSALAYALSIGLNATQHENTADPDKALMEYSAKWSAQEDVWVRKVIGSIENGLEWIANQYPENLKMEVENMGECSNHEKVKEIAEKLNGIAYGENVSDIEAEAKKHGIVIVMGASDDLMKFSGAIVDEGGVAYAKGGKVYFDRSSVSQDDTESANVIEAIWCKSHDENGVLATWAYKTKIPHEKFKVFEDEELYCIGIVFSVEDLE
jgi:uncharacterized protein YsxB (DUF464 family)